MGKIRSFQINTIASNAAVDMGAFDNGNITLNRNPILEHPSILAASLSSFGIDLKKAVRIKIDIERFQALNASIKPK